MATQLLETQQVPGVKEAMNAAKDAADKATEAEAVAEVAKVAAAKAADSAADSAISAEHAEHTAESAVESANKAIETAEAATEATTAATEQLQESVAKIDGLEQRVDEAEGQVVEFREELDAMQSASDVVDIVDTKAQLDAYDTSKIHANDVIKVLQDETHDGAITYYRFKDTARSADQWEYIGETGPYYTKSEADAKFANKDDTTFANDGNYVVGQVHRKPATGSSRLDPGDNPVVSFGENTFTDVASGLAFGRGNVLSGGIAIGDNNTVVNGRTIGNYNTVNRSYALVVGDSYGASTPVPYFVANVRAGEEDTDAVNFKQMKDYVADNAGGGASVVYSDTVSKASGNTMLASGIELPADGIYAITVQGFVTSEPQPGSNSYVIRLSTGTANNYISRNFMPGDVTPWASGSPTPLMASTVASLKSDTIDFYAAESMAGDIEITVTRIA